MSLHDRKTKNSSLRCSERFISVLLSLLSCRVNSINSRIQAANNYIVLTPSKTQRKLSLLFASLLLTLAYSSNSYSAAPEAVADKFFTPGYTSISDDLSLNDLHLDGPTDVYSMLTEPANGNVIVNPDGAFTYTPNFGFAGLDTFTYQIDDGAGDSDIATVSINVAASRDNIFVASSTLTTVEDTSVPLGITVDPELASGGAIPDTFATEVGFRGSSAGSTPVIVSIPTKTSIIRITGFSTRNVGLSGVNDADNDDHAVLTALISLTDGKSSGSMAYMANTHGSLTEQDQYSWSDVSLGSAVLDDPSKITGLHTYETANPTFTLVGTDLHISDIHDLQTAYLIEFMTSDDESANFIRAENSHQSFTQNTSSLSIPSELEPDSGKKGFIVLNGYSARSGKAQSREPKGFSRIIIDLESMLVSGTIAAENGEGSSRTLTYAFREYPLIDLRASGTSTPVSVLTDNTYIVGDTTISEQNENDLTIFINASGGLVIQRNTNFADTYTSMYTAALYERTGNGSTASVVGVSSDSALFDANPSSTVDSDGKLINELLFDIPATAEVGIFRLSWASGVGTGVNEDTGGSFAVIDLRNQTTSGSALIMRMFLPDLVSWGSVPLGQTMFGALDTGGDPLFVSNRTAGNFRDPFVETATFSIITNVDGTQTLKYEATSPTGQDYRGNAQVSWMGYDSFELSGFLTDGTLSHGTMTPSGIWNVEINDIPLLSYIPKEHVSGLDLLTLTAPSGETERITVSIEPVADAVTLSTTNAQGNANTSIPLAISVTDSLDQDSSETQLSTLELTEIPSSVTLSATAGSLIDNGSGSWSVSRTALETLSATGTEVLSQVIGVSAINRDAIDIDGDTLIEDGDNGSGVDEEDEFEVNSSFTLTINSIPVATTVSSNAGADTDAVLSLATSISDDDNDQDLSSIDLNPSVVGNQDTISTSDGVWSVNSSGVINFNPAPEFEGIATISFNVEDSRGNESNFANIDILVAGAFPVATFETAFVATDVDATIDLSDNISDANDDVDFSTIDLNPSTAGNQSSLTSDDGVWLVTTAGQLTFNPTAEFEGTSSISYTVEDDDGNESPSTIVSVTVGGARPLATADSTTVTADVDATIDLSDNISDANNDVDIGTIDLNPNVAGNQSSLTTNDGVWLVTSTGLLTFNPAVEFEGTSNISYTVEDDDGNESPSAIVSVTVAGAYPIATAATATVATDINATINLSDNVSDVNNDVDIGTIDLDPGITGNQSSLTTTDGIWIVTTSGLLTFDPDADFEGTSSVVYTVEDDDGNESLSAAVSVTVGGATPIATADSMNVAADVNAIIDLSDNVSDANNDVDLSTIDLDPATAGNHSTKITNDGVWNVTVVGLITFNPDPDFEGMSSIAYTVEDDDGNESPPAIVSVTVDGATPIASAETANVTADGNVTIDLSDNVTDANNDVDISSIDLNPDIAGNQSSLTTNDGVWIVTSAGLLSFNPDEEFEGISSISYSVEDDDGNESPSAIVSVTVDGATPMASAETATVAADVNAIIDLSDNITDTNNDVDTSTIDLDPSTAGNQSSRTTSDGVWIVTANGLLTFNPDSDFEGMTSIAYTVEDDDGNESALTTLSVVVGGAKPLVSVESAAITSNDNATIDLSDNVSDANNDVDITTIDLNPTTAGVQSLVTTNEGRWSVDAEGLISFEPAFGFEGIASIPLTIADDDGNVSDPVDITVTVGGAIPTANNANANVATGANVAINLKTLVADDNNDIDLGRIDLDPTVAGIQSTLSNTYGVWSVDAEGVLVYTPSPNFEGVATLSYVVSDDDDNESNIADVTVFVGLDSDHDGVLDFTDLDVDNDGIPDSVEGTDDTDRDGIFNIMDLDSDNDGIPDIVEAGGVDVNNDGVIDFFTDNNQDGLADSTTSSPLPVYDFDKDGIADFLDSDSDGDGLSDTFEAGTVDTNGDGIADRFNTPIDTDADDSPDYLDLDSDNDGILDALEGHDDQDGDGYANVHDLDSDNDGIPDIVESGALDTNGDGQVDKFADTNEDGLDDGLAVLPLARIDTDRDGLLDFEDLDSDNDGLPDTMESPFATEDLNGDGQLDTVIDIDGNGWRDNAPTESTFDNDGDGIFDHLDIDSDGDGFNDLIEAGGIDINGDGIGDAWLDTDEDGIPDTVDVDQTGSNDSDADGIADFADADIQSEDDTDGDGIIDQFDVDPFNDGFARQLLSEPSLSSAIPTGYAAITYRLRGSGSMGMLALFVILIIGLSRTRLQ